MTSKLAAAKMATWSGVRAVIAAASRPDVLAGGKRKAADMKPGDLAKGGVLEALRILGQPQAKTQNWENPTGFTPGRAWRVAWVPVLDLDPDMDMERDPRDEEHDPLKRRPRTAPEITRAVGAGNADDFALCHFDRDRRDRDQALIGGGDFMHRQHDDPPDRR